MKQRSNHNDNHPQLQRRKVQAGRETTAKRNIHDNTMKHDRGTSSKMESNYGRNLLMALLQAPGWLKDERLACPVGLLQSAYKNQDGERQLTIHQCYAGF